MQQVKILLTYIYWHRRVEDLKVMVPIWSINTEKKIWRITSGANSVGVYLYTMHVTKRSRHIRYLGLEIQECSVWMFAIITVNPSDPRSRSNRNQRNHPEVYTKSDKWIGTPAIVYHCSRPMWHFRMLNLQKEEIWNYFWASHPPHWRLELVSGSPHRVQVQIEDKPRHVARTQH